MLKRIAMLSAHTSPLEQPGTGDAGGMNVYVLELSRQLAARGIEAEAPTSPDGSDDFRTTWIVDPDGNRIELVQWPAGHADGMTAADFED